MKRNRTTIVFAGVAALSLGLAAGIGPAGAQPAPQNGIVAVTSYVEADLPEFPSDPPTTWQDIDDIRAEVVYAGGHNASNGNSVVVVTNPANETDVDDSDYAAGEAEYREPGGTSIGEARTKNFGSSTGDELQLTARGELTGNGANTSFQFDWFRVGLTALVDLQSVDVNNSDGDSVVSDGSGTAVAAFAPGASVLSTLGDSDPVGRLGSDLFDFVDAETDRDGLGTVNSLFDDGDNAITASIVAGALVTG